MEDVRRGTASTQGSAPQDDPEPRLRQAPEEQTLLIQPSALSGRRPSVFFPYPAATGLQRGEGPAIRARLRKPGNMHFKLGSIEYSCVRIPLHQAGFRRTNGPHWNVFWGRHLQPAQFRKLIPFQKVNHFPDTWCIGRKDRLARAVTRKQRQHPTQFDFMAKSYVLPYDAEELSRDLDAHPRWLWILKPPASACGRGIKLFNRKMGKRLRKNRAHLVQRYIHNPLLVRGFKFDLRVYVLVTSFDPLRVYIYHDGLARFCSSPYSTTASGLRDRYRHLTNYSVNKRSADYKRNTSAADDGTGHKWSIRALLRHLEETGVDTGQLWKSIRDVVVKTLIAAEPTVTSAVNSSMRHRGLCFELFGFDILIDAKLKAWLIEVNVCPSLASSAPLDRKIKTSLLTDVFHLVGFVPYSARRAARELKHVKQTRLLGVAAARSAKGTGAAGGDAAGAESPGAMSATRTGTSRGSTAPFAGSSMVAASSGSALRASGVEQDTSSAAAAGSAAPGRLERSASGSSGGARGGDDEESRMLGLEAGNVSELDLDAGEEEEDGGAGAHAPATWEEIPVDFEPDDPFSVTPSRAANGRRAFSGDSAQSAGAGSDEEDEDEDEGDDALAAASPEEEGVGAAGDAWWLGDEAALGVPCGDPAPPESASQGDASAASTVRTVRRLRAGRRGAARGQGSWRSAATSSLNAFGLPAAQSLFAHLPPRRRRRRRAGGSDGASGGQSAAPTEGESGAGETESEGDGASESAGPSTPSSSSPRHAHSISLTDGLELLPGGDAVARMHAHRRIRRGLMASRAAAGAEPPQPPSDLSPLQVVPAFSVEGVEDVGVEQWGVAELEVVAEMEEEYLRRGNFTLAFPGPDCDKFLPLFDRRRYNNTLCSLWLRHKRETGALLPDLATLLAKAVQRAAATAAAAQAPAAGATGSQRRRRAHPEPGRSETARRVRPVSGHPASRTRQRSARKEEEGPRREKPQRARLPPRPQRAASASRARPQRAASASRARPAPGATAGASAKQIVLVPRPEEQKARPSSRVGDVAEAAAQTFMPLRGAFNRLQPRTQAHRAGSEHSRERLVHQATQRFEREAGGRRGTSAPYRGATGPTEHESLAEAAAGTAWSAPPPGWGADGPPHTLIGSFSQRGAAAQESALGAQSKLAGPSQRKATGRIIVGGAPTPASLLRNHFLRGPGQRVQWPSAAEGGSSRPGSAHSGVPWVRREAVVTGFARGRVSPLTSGQADAGSTEAGPVEAGPAPELADRSPRSAAPRGRRPKSAAPARHRQGLYHFE